METPNGRVRWSLWSSGFGFVTQGQAMKMWDQFNEVPNKRIAIDPETSDLYVTGGLVTRAWPDEVHSEEEHKRVFHYGYQHGHTVFNSGKNN